MTVLRALTPHVAVPFALAAVLSAPGLVNAAKPEKERCADRYHLESKFLANPDESKLIAAVIGWCRKHQRRLLWDERYAAVARTWSAFLFETGEPGERSLPQDRLRFELGTHGVTDFAVLPYSALSRAEHVPSGLIRFLDERVERGRYTHFAVGVARSRDQRQMVSTLLLGRRPALIDPLPVCPAPGTRLDLRLRLRRDYSHPRWLMTTPRGRVIKGALLYEEGFWQGRVPLDAGRGEYTMEIVVHGPAGPEVAALFGLYAGTSRPELPRTKIRPAPGRYRTPAEAERALFRMLNQARSRQGLPALKLHEQLSTIARKHAMQLLFDRHATHRTTQTGTLTDRLRRLAVRFDRALENVSLSPSPQAAHERFMASPGHRINVLDPNVNQVGIGVAMERTPAEDILAVCQVFIENPQDPADAATARKILELINGRRRQRGRFALGLDSELSELARHSARRLAALGNDADPQSEGERLLEGLRDRGGAVVEVNVRYFRTRDPGRVLASPEIGQENINRLGVGIARSGDANRPGGMWIALIFAGR